MTWDRSVDSRMRMCPMGRVAHEERLRGVAHVGGEREKERERERKREKERESKEA